MVGTATCDAYARAPGLFAHRTDPRVFDIGHFALETHAAEIAEAISGLLSR
jgi:hypothetical protein